MLLEEALWVQSQLALMDDIKLNKMLNVGSSTLDFRTKDQPYIDEKIFKPLRSRQIKILNLDLKKDEGVDINGDLLDTQFQKKLADYRFSSAICSNLLEHVRSPDKFCRAIVDVVKPGAIIVVTVPYRYPYHKDPIDTLFRPTTQQLAAMFPGTKVLLEEYVKSNTSMLDNMISNWKYGVLSILRFLKFYNADWKYYVPYLKHIYKNYTVTCVILEKL